MRAFGAQQSTRIGGTRVHASMRKQIACSRTANRASKPRKYVHTLTHVGDVCDWCWLEWCPLVFSRATRERLELLLFAGVQSHAHAFKIIIYVYMANMCERASPPTHTHEPHASYVAALVHSNAKHLQIVYSSAHTRERHAHANDTNISTLARENMPFSCMQSAPAAINLGRLARVSSVHGEYCVKSYRARIAVAAAAAGSSAPIRVRPAWQCIDCPHLSVVPPLRCVRLSVFVSTCCVRANVCARVHALE